MQKLVRVLGFILVFCCIFFGVTEKLFKRRIDLVDYIYNHAPKNSIDILFIGSSHSYCAFNTKLFDNKLEVDSYNLGTGSQSIQGSYYAIKEILKKQDIKIVILEGYSLYIEKEGKEKSYANTKNIYDDMKFSLNKLQMAIENFSKRDRLFQMFTTTAYHERWKEIEYLYFNFNKDMPLYKGFSGYKFNYVRATLNYTLYESNYNTKFRENFPKRNMELFEKLAKELKEKNIKLILVSVPVVPRDNFLKSKYSIETDPKIKEIAQKYDVDIINFNDGKDKFEKICFLDDMHLSLAGSDLISEKVAQIIKEKHGDLLEKLKKEIKDKSVEYYFYNKNSILNDGIFTQYIIDAEIEKGLIIKEVNMWKKGINLFDIYLKIETENNPYFYIENGEKETQLKIFNRVLKFKKNIVKDSMYKSLNFPKYYIRKINENYYIYIKDFRIDENKLPIDKNLKME